MQHYKNRFIKYKNKNNIMIGGFIEGIRCIIEKFFDYNLIDVKYNEDDDEYSVIVYCKTKEDDIYMIEFYIKNQTKDILISSIYKCGEHTGTETMNKIIEMGCILNSKNIHLLDASVLFSDTDCEFSLSHYMILLKGISWYNKFGFVSESYDEELQINENIRSMPIENFIAYSIENKKKTFLDDLESRMTRILDKFHNTDIKIDSNASILNKIQNDFYLEILKYDNHDQFLDSKIKEEFSKNIYNQDYILEQVSNIGINKSLIIKEAIKILDDKINENRNISECENVHKITEIIVKLSEHSLSYRTQLTKKMV